MSYVAKREFAARVFTVLIELVRVPDVWPIGEDIILLLAQAQLDGLPSEWDIEVDEGCCAVHEQGAGRDLDAIDAAYALAVQLAPLVGTEVME